MALCLSDIHKHMTQRFHAKVASQRRLFDGLLVGGRGTGGRVGGSDKSVVEFDTDTELEFENAPNLHQGCERHDG